MRLTAKTYRFKGSSNRLCFRVQEHSLNRWTDWSEESKAAHATLTRAGVCAF